MELLKVDTSVSITLKDLTDLIGVEHNKAMKKVEELALEPSFGTLAKIATVYNNKGQTIQTYLLTKKQVIAAGARLNNSLLMKVIDKMEELEKERQSIFSIPQTYSEALLLASKQAEQIEQQKELIAIQAPKADFYDAVTGSKDTVDIGTVAKVLNMGIGCTKLFQFLCDNGVLMKDNQPYQRYIDGGWFRVIESKYTKPDGSTHVNTKTVVYQKGVDYIRKMLEQSK